MFKVLSVFAGPYALLARWAVIALVVAAFGAFAWMKGNAHGTAKLHEYQAKQASEAVRLAAARERVSVQVVTKYLAAKAKTQVVTQYIEKKVVDYGEANPGFCLDAAWRVLHDDAAANRVPAAGFKPDGEGRAPAGFGAVGRGSERR